MPRIAIHYQVGAQFLAQQLFGPFITDEEIGALAGALDGAAVQVSVRKTWLFLDVSDPLRFASYQTSIRIDDSGALYAYIHDVHTKPSQQKQGWGARAFRRQVEAAQRLGVQRFELFAAGHPGDRSDIGYYVWARFGFNAPLRADEKSTLPDYWRDITDINQLIRRGGQKWWWANGDFREMVFELRPNSAMMQIFRDYLKEKNIPED
jgi:GNAT superfamily N-acetyltransferase